MGTRSSGLADGITARQRSANSRVIRLDRELGKVNSGPSRRSRSPLLLRTTWQRYSPAQRRDNSLALFDSGLPPDEVLRDSTNERQWADPRTGRLHNGDESQ
jgi:hypothetical protein